MWTLPFFSSPLGESAVLQCRHTFLLLCKYAISCKITTPKTSHFLKKKTILSDKVFMLILGQNPLLNKKVWQMRYDRREHCCPHPVLSAPHASVQASASRHECPVVSESSLLAAFSRWSFVFLTQDESNLDAFFCRTLCDMFDILGCYLIQLYIKHIPTVSCPVSGGLTE